MEMELSITKNDRAVVVGDCGRGNLLKQLDGRSSWMGEAASLRMQESTAPRRFLPLRTLVEAKISPNELPKMRSETGCSSAREKGHYLAAKTRPSYFRP